MSEEQGRATRRCGLPSNDDLHRFMMEASPDPIVVLQDDRYHYVNPAFSQVFGYSAGEVAAGMSFYRLVADADRALVRQRYQDRLAGRPLSRTFQIRLIAKDGSTIHCETSASRIDVGGRPADLVIIRDITERIQVEQELASKRRMLDILASFELQLRAPDLGLVLSRGTELIAAAVGCTRVSVALVDPQRDGVNLVTVRGDGSSVPKGTYLPTGLAGLFRVLQTGEPLYRSDLTAGPERYDDDLTAQLLREGLRSSFVVPLFADEVAVGTLNCAASTVDGIAAEARQLVELLAPRLAAAVRSAQLFEAVRDSEARLRGLLENSIDQIFVTDQQGVVRWASPSVYRMRAIPSEKLLGTSGFELIHPDDRERLTRATAQLIAQPDRTQHISYRVRHGDGTWREYEGVVTNMLADPRVGGLVVNSRDVTERRALEAEAQRRERLESLGLLAGGLAHDFNNLLMAILGNLEIARGVLSDHAACRQLDAAAGAARRATDVTRQLLAFARGGGPLKRLVSVAALARETADFALHGSNVRCDLDVRGTPWPAQIDPGQIGQVIHNLLLNADQAMPDGGVVRLTIENVPAIQAKAKGDCVRISIADEGAGIDPADRDKIFDPYFTTKPGGSGLGLATAYAIARRHDGTLRVESTPGVGSTFHLELPAEPGGVVRPKPVAPADITRRARILVMDDDACVRKATCRMLEVLGQIATSAAEGQEAISLYMRERDAGRPFDAVIMDLTVPGGTGGKEAVRRLLQIDPDATVIVASGYSDDPVMSHYRDHGFCAALRKPFDMQALKRVLEQVLPSDGKPA